MGRDGGIEPAGNRTGDQGHGDADGIGRRQIECNHGGGAAAEHHLAVGSQIDDAGAQRQGAGEP